MALVDSTPDPWEAMRGRVPEPPKDWVKGAVEGHILEGFITGRHTLPPHPEYPPCDALDVTDRSGREWSVRCSRKALRDLVERDDPQPGDLIVLQCWGMRGKANAYTWVVEHASVKPNEEF